LNVFFFGELRIMQLGSRLPCAVSKDFNFPALRGFLAFWQERLEGPLFSVAVAHSKLIKPAELRAVDRVFPLH
jgi:uncharacterized protein Usg